MVGDEFCGVAGVQPQGQYFRGSWREAIETGFEAETVKPLARDVELPDQTVIRRFGADPALLPGGRFAETGPEARLPDWALRPAPAEPALARSAAPSRLQDADQAPAPSPLARTNGLGR